MIGYLKRQWPWWLLNVLLLMFSGFMVGWSASKDLAFTAAANAVCGGFALSNLMSEFLIRKIHTRIRRDFPMDVEMATEAAVLRGIRSGLTRAEVEGLLLPEAMRQPPPSTRH